MRLSCLIALIILAGAGCAGEPEDGPEPPAAETSSIQVPEPAPPRAPRVTEFSVTETEVRLVAPDGWPARALDPHVTVAGVKLTRYDHPAPTVIRFFADGAKLDLTDGTPLVLQYGDDPRSVIVVGQ